MPQAQKLQEKQQFQNATIADWHFQMFLLLEDFYEMRREGNNIEKSFKYKVFDLRSYIDSEYYNFLFYKHICVKVY